MLIKDPKTGKNVHCVGHISPLACYRNAEEFIAELERITSDPNYVSSSIYIRDPPYYHDREIVIEVYNMENEEEKKARILAEKKLAVRAQIDADAETERELAIYLKVKARLENEK